MIKRPGRYSLITLMLFMLCAFLVTEAATKRQAKEAELNQLRARIDALRTDLNQVRDRYDGMRNELRDLEQRIASLRKNIAGLDSQLDVQQSKLQGLARKQQRLETGLSDQREQLARQLRAAYAVGRQEYVKILLNQEDPAAVGRMVTYYDYLNRARLDRMAAINATLAELVSVKADITTETRQLQRLRDDAAEEKQNLEESRNQRAALVSKLKGEIHSKDQQLSRLMADEKELQKLIAALGQVMEDIPPDIEGKPFDLLKGKLGWPTKGSFLAQYGARRNVGSLNWQGVLIGAPEGQPVRAIANGRVAFAEWLRGYGLLLIIDHGNGYMSLYGYNQSLYKSVGEWVKAGDIVAAVGSSGGQDQNGLYFEIRHNGKPANPSLWCRR